MTSRSTAALEASAARISRQQAAEILERYPDISEVETAKVLRFLRTGRHLDVGMLTATEALRPQLDAFTAEHKRKLSLGFTETATAFAGIAGFLALCWLVWEAIAPGAV